jgi:hypothetical protein
MYTTHAQTTVIAGVLHTVRVPSATRTYQHLRDTSRSSFAILARRIADMERLTNRLDYYVGGHNGQVPTTPDG